MVINFINVGKKENFDIKQLSCEKILIFKKGTFLLPNKLKLRMGQTYKL